VHGAEEGALRHRQEVGGPLQEGAGPLQEGEGPLLEGAGLLLEGAGPLQEGAGPGQSLVVAQKYARRYHLSLFFIVADEKLHN
jgi:hypothetical protein